MRLALVPLLLALAPSPAGAHETRHEVRRGEAIAVRAYHPGGRGLAQASFEVFSPAEPSSPFLQGSTDRHGWLAFVPDAPGDWRVRIVDDHGHGIDVRVEAAAPPAAAAPAPPASPPAPAAVPPPGPTAAFVLRPLAGVAAIGAVFTLLFLTWRRRDRG